MIVHKDLYALVTELDRMVAERSPLPSKVPYPVSLSISNVIGTLTRIYKGTGIRSAEAGRFQRNVSTLRGHAASPEYSLDQAVRKQVERLLARIAEDKLTTLVPQQYVR